MKKWRKLLIALVVLAVLFGVVYIGLGVYIYNMVSVAAAHCSNNEATLANTPAQFAVQDPGVPLTVNLADYYMPAYEEISFPSRVDNLELKAWYVPAATNPESAPAVVIVHGLSSCKNSAYILFPAGMLHKAGFNVLMLDMRDHGESTIEDGRFAGGTEEYRDVLGAWDWFVHEKGLPPERVGLFGTSLGAASVLIAGGEEPLVPAVWEDSSYGDINTAITAELGRYGVPGFFAPAASLVAKFVSGDDLLARSPIEGLRKMAGRPVYITHGTADKRLSVNFAYDLAEVARQSDSSFEPWIIEGAEHVQQMWMDSAGYEERLIAFFQRTLGAA